MNITVVFLIGVCLIELHGENVVCLCMKQSCQLYFSPLYLDKSVNYHPQREALCYVLTSFEGLLSSSFVSYFIWSVAGHWHYVRTDSTTIPTRFYSRSGLKLNAVRISVVCHHVSLLNQLNFSCVQFRFGCSVGCYSSFELASVLRWTLVSAARRARRRVGSAAGLLVPLPQSGFFLVALHDTMIHLKCFMTLRETLTLCDRCRPSTLSAGITKGSSSCAVTRTAAWRCGTSETPPSHSRSPSLTVRHTHSHNPRDKSWVYTLCIDLNIIDCKQTSVDHMLSSDLPSSSWLCCFSQCNQPPFSLIHQHSCSVTCTFRVLCCIQQWLSYVRCFAAASFWFPHSVKSASSSAVSPYGFLSCRAHRTRQICVFLLWAVISGKITKQKAGRMWLTGRGAQLNSSRSFICQIFSVTQGENGRKRKGRHENE